VSALLTGLGIVVGCILATSFGSIAFWGFLVIFLWLFWVL
jgi:hypothetical protein